MNKNLPFVSREAGDQIGCVYYDVMCIGDDYGRPLYGPSRAIFNSRSYSDEFDGNILRASLTQQRR